MDTKNGDGIKEILFHSAMRGHWRRVINIYRNNPWIHGAKITRSGETALHIAVSEGKDDIVEDLIKIIIDRPEVLRIGDELKNTPLHTAAALGNVKMCICIASVDKSLIGVRNEDGETPFFMAARRGHKHVFLCLRHLCGTIAEGYGYIRRKNGDSILHCAIAGDHFDLAFQIIHHYEDLVNSGNQQGLTPLHLLAAKPSVFRSRGHLGFFDWVIYNCISVERERLKVEYSWSQSLKAISSDVKATIYPPNYETCHNLIILLRKAIRAGTPYVTKAASGGREEESPITQDAENPEESYFSNPPPPPPLPANTSAPLSASNNSDRINTVGYSFGPPPDIAHGYQLAPPNYSSCFQFVKLVFKIIPFLGLGSTYLNELREMKKKHTWSVQIMNTLLSQASRYGYEQDGGIPEPALTEQEDNFGVTVPYAIDESGKITFSENAFFERPTITPPNETIVNETHHLINQKASRRHHFVATASESPILIAAKNGITEMVEKILKLFPVAIQDLNDQGKNAVLLAVENRQPEVYQLLLKMTNKKESVFQKVDHEGNSALHLAAKFGGFNSWIIPGGAALQMQWEIKWYEFVKDSVPFNFFLQYNKENKSSSEIFTETHEDLVKEGGEWLNKTSQSCSVVATLITTVAFAASTTVPGGTKAESGTPTLENEPAFLVFGISSLVAFSFSTTAVIMFLAITTTWYQERDFKKDLPRKLVVGFTSLFISLASMLISFFTGHFFVLRDKLKYGSLPLYALTCLPVTFFTAAQFPLYLDLVWVTFTKMPQRNYRSIHPSRYTKTPQRS